MINETTRQTRKEAHEAVKPHVNAREELILETLGDRHMTVSEIVASLVARGFIPYYDRNKVAPRLTELKEKWLVTTCGKRESKISGRNEAIWRQTTEDEKRWGTDLIYEDA